MRLAVWVLVCSIVGCAGTQAPDEPRIETYARPSASILTPNVVETRVGTLELFDGLPHERTVDTVYDHLDFLRAVRAYLQTLGGTSTMAMRKGMDAAGMLPNYSVLLTESMMDSRSLFLTGDSETVYALAWISLKGGPIVVETPPRALGVFTDAWQRPLAETGKAGPDRGRGGRYVIVPPEYAGYVPRSQFAVESPTFGVWAVFRGFLSKGSPKRAVATFKRELKIYPLKESARPPPNVFIDVSGRAFNTIAPSDASYYELIDELVQEEPNAAQDPELLGLLASIGIEKDTRFSPDARMQSILREAAAVGNATARALLFASRDPEARLYDDRQWQRILLGRSEKFLRDGVRLLDAQARFYAYATAVTPTMARPEVGTGSDAAAVFRDRRGRRLDGGRTYTLTLPANVPAAYFWSITVYDNQTRSMLQTDQRFPAILSGQKGLRRNEDGSITLRFGPKPPRSRANRGNWIQTVPEKGWNAIFRLYGPEAPWFDATWRPGDLELVTDLPGARSPRKPPAMRTDAPSGVFSPERMDTRIGPLELVDGFPSDETVDRVYDHLDFIRGVDAFLTTLPGASMVALRRGLREAGVDANDAVALFERGVDAHAVLLTASPDRLVAGTWLDLRDGAFVVEAPSGANGIVNDSFSRYVADLGRSGSDEGKGGLFLFVPPAYEGQISELYFNYVSRTYGNLLMWNAPPVDGDAAVARFVEALDVYPLELEISDEEIDFSAEETEPTADAVEDEDRVRIVRLSGKPLTAVHSSDFGFYEEVAELVREEPKEALGPELLGLLAAIGIERSSRFAPDPRTREILVESAAVASVTARAIAFRHRDPSARLYDGSAWYTPFVGRSSRHERRGARLLDARTLFSYLETRMSPARLSARVGTGTEQALAVTDSEGRYLDGGRSYRLTLPSDVPAKDFWSLAVYDPQTRSMLQTPRSATPSLSSRGGTIVANPDGSTTIHFGPNAPAGREANWIQTVPDKGWFVILRLHGPLQPWFDDTWRPGELERVD